jgi:hypothetical protein
MTWMAQQAHFIHYIVKPMGLLGHPMMKVITVVRAGILFKEKTELLLDLIVSMLASSFEDKTKCREIANVYIEEIGQFDRAHLLNNPFWGRNSHARLSKPHYTRKKPTTWTAKLTHLPIGFT